MTTILDGGMGMEMIHRSGIQDGALWSADVLHDNPGLVTEIHRDFIQAGAHVITTCNYTSTRPRLAASDREDELESLLTSAMNCARQAVKESGREVRIAGSLPPLVASYHAEDALSYEESFALYVEMSAHLADSVDLLICETMTSRREARAAVNAAAQTGKPVWCSFVTRPEDDGPPCLRDGTPLRDVIHEIDVPSVTGWLVNCIPPEYVSTCLGVFSQRDKAFGAYANGFSVLPDGWRPKSGSAKLGVREDLTPEIYTKFAQRWHAEGATIIGGCCNVGPDHIRSVAEAVG